MKSVDDEESRSVEYNLPPRKSVLFKEYAFSVQESIATGLPIIPFVGPSGLTERKRKKDAAKRSAEVKTKTDHISDVGGTSLEALLRIANEEWLRENEEEQMSSNHNTSIDTSEHSSTSLASTVRRSFKTNLITLDRRRQQTPPSRMAVHPKVLEATKANSPSVENKPGSRVPTVAFGPTSHRWIPRRTNVRDSYIDNMYLQQQQFHQFPQQFLCRPAQFYAVHQPSPAFFTPFQPPRMPIYSNDTQRVKLVRQMPDYVDMRQIKFPIEDEGL